MSKITLDVELRTKMKALDDIKAKPDLKLTSKQQEAYERNKRGAETALKTGDLKAFRNYFNNMAEILKKASVASGQISKNLQALTDRQEQINKDIQKLKEERDKLKKSITSSKGEGTLSRDKANELLEDFKDKKKILGKNGDQLNDASVINSRVQKLGQTLETAGKTWSQVTDKMAQAAGFKDKASAQAAHRFYEGEQKYIADTQKQITTIDNQITAKETEQTSLSNEIDKIKTTAPDAAKALELIYAELSKIKTATNTTITNAQSEKRAEEAGKQTGAGVDVTPLAGNIKQQTSALGRAFKQFTLYNVALRAVRRALREAVQTVKELDKELTEQAMVTGLTREQTYKLVKSYQDLAQQTGATTKEIAGVATEYMKQGKSIQEAMTLTEAAVSAAKVARVSTADSVNYLTTALNGFQLSAKDAMLVSDKFAAVAAASATDYDELAIALSKVASQANLAGMSIDYTTALLTKGLETTREAPETMGTALKTIIARMRELSDYGETLEGDTDINNVESQLAYVGIALRNNEGELRSTEEVLDELGKKWETLDKNQQAAVAKALAGTRQQSRLIAIMTDYERVTELQEIAQRSAGATAAQAGVYLEGIEAALNKITIGWEKIVTSVTDSDAIIDLLNFIGGTLDSIGNFLNTDFGLVTTLTVAVGLTASMLSNKMQEAMYSKVLAGAEKHRQVLLLKDQIITRKSLIAKQQELLTEKQQTRQQRAQTKQQIIQEKLAEGTMTATEAELALTQIDAEIAAEEAAIAAEIASLKTQQVADEMQLSMLGQDNAANWATIGQTVSMVGGGLGTLLSGSSEWLVIMTLIGLAFKAIPPIIKTIRLAQSMANAQEAAEGTRNSLIKMAGAATGLGVPGLIIAAALMALAGIAAVASIVGGISKQKETTEEKVNNLSNEIYKLQEKANAIDQITSSFDSLDNKIIKTSKDIEEMNSLLDQAADKLSDEVGDDEDIGYGKGISEKEHYQTLGSEKAKREFLEQIEKEARNEAAKKRRTQIDLLRSNSELLNENTTNNEIKKAQSVLYANATYNLQNYIDKLKDTKKISNEVASSVEKMASAILDESNLQQAFSFADNPQKVEALVNRIKDLTLNATDASGELKEISTAEILTSDDYGITTKVEAFEQLKEALGEGSEAYKLLASAYQEYSVFAEMSDDVLQMIDNLEISIDDINKLGEAWKTLRGAGLDIDEETWKKMVTDAEGGILDTFAKTGGNVKATIDQLFGSYLSGADDYVEAYNSLVNVFSNLVGKGMLNMGQNITKLKNTVNSFYEKAAEWSEMSDQEKTEFMSENANLFKGKSGEKLLDALNRNDWRVMESLLRDAEGMQDDIQEELKWIETELSIEEAKIGEARNEAYIQQLKAWKDELQDQTNFFRADLEFLIEQEQKQLDIYREFLEKQQEQLEESLDKRREAYEKYFEAVNQQIEDEDYQEQSDKLVENLSKLSSSSDFASQKQARELQQQLEELEKERQQELRERAQEAMIASIDNEVEEINDKFDKLLDNEELLLQAMKGSAQDPTFITQLMASARESGMTNLQLEEYAQELQTAFGSMKNVNTDNIKEIMEQITNNATINVGDQTFDLNTEDGNAMWETILAMLIKYGYGR